jgi:hypothetical protein
METELGNPIEYSPDILEQKPEEVREQPGEQEQQYFYQPPPQFMVPPEPVKNTDLLASLDKVAYIVIFVAFILGFFMGKTMQPVILLPG